jgi:hypothetical protein
MSYLDPREHMDAIYNHRSKAHLRSAAISAMHAQWVKSDCSTVKLMQRRSTISCSDEKHWTTSEQEKHERCTSSAVVRSLSLAHAG